jgi:hypothetical protein
VTDGKHVYDSRAFAEGINVPVCRRLFAEKQMAEFPVRGIDFAVVDVFQIAQGAVGPMNQISYACAERHLELRGRAECGRS